MKNRSNANRGKKLEKKIDDANGYYRDNGIADIVKIPTPVRIMRVDGGMVRGTKQQGYLVDYIGTVNGHAIAFDAKETNLKSLPLANIHTHQYNMMKSWHLNGATTFLLVHFKEMDEYYILGFEHVEKVWNDMLEGGRKSIAYDVFVQHGRFLEKNNGILNYLEGL